MSSQTTSFLPQPSGRLPISFERRWQGFSYKRAGVLSLTLNP